MFFGYKTFRTFEEQRRFVWKSSCHSDQCRGQHRGVFTASCRILIAAYFGYLLCRLIGSWSPLVSQPYGFAHLSYHFSSNTQELRLILLHCVRASPPDTIQPSSCVQVPTLILFHVTQTNKRISLFLQRLLSLVDSVETTALKSSAVLQSPMQQ